MADARTVILRRLLDANDPSLREAAWTDFVGAYSKLILHVARSLSGDQDGAMDHYAHILDQLSCDDFRRLRRYVADGRSEFATWLVIVAQRLCHDRDRQRYGRLRTVVGYSYVPDDLSYSAVRWQQVGGVWTVTELPSGDFAGATDLNERGDATGSRRSATGTAHAYLWPTGGGSPVDLGTLGGSTSHALGINVGGETVGWSYNRTGVTRAFWRSGNRMTDLGTLMSARSAAAMAEAINDAGLVVGSSQSTGGSGAIWHAVLWTTRQ